MARRWPTVALYSDGNCVAEWTVRRDGDFALGETVSCDEIGIVGAAPGSAISVTLSRDGSTVARCDLAGGAPVFQAVDRVGADRVGIEVASSEAQR